ncbi:FK506-binding protein-like [Pempheris klunzingeri]|uniref:FK506-binding protein-like n=1 Tax=Pempheris klunzingeri TaxID=3127111 RepID=UPI0039801EA8
MDTEMDLPLEALHSNSDHDGVDVTSWVSVCPRGLWKVQQRRTSKRSQQIVSNCGDDALCSSSHCPRMGSLCRVRVRLKANTDKTESLVSEKGHEKLSVHPDQSVTEVTEAAATNFPRCQESVLQVPLDDWTTLRLGEGQCDITEACVEGMKAGEKCEIVISPLGNGPDDSVCHPAEENLPLWATVELQTFTPGKESWEMSPGDKWEWVKSHKERGGVRFKSGDVWGAADSYSRALKLLITLHGQDGRKQGHKQEVEEQRDNNSGDKTLQLPSANEFRTTKAELHSNLSLCQLKLDQPERAKASAAKATQLEPGGTKAWYRLGQACQMVNELEEAKQAFRKLLELQPDSPAALKALKNIANREKETNAQLGLRLSKMFS